MEDQLKIQGRILYPQDITGIVSLIAEYPTWSRWKLSNYLSEKGYWDFEAGNLRPLIAFLKNLK
ncbi:MAG: hypothetical protein KAW12_07855 [Candidatus Aminicenantes bacterium]|nr:hypothetical protein [Candidatus Aminicenantes bacterium]